MKNVNLIFFFSNQLSLYFNLMLFRQDTCLKLYRAIVLNLIVNKITILCNKIIFKVKKNVRINIVLYSKCRIRDYF